MFASGFPVDLLIKIRPAEQKAAAAKSDLMLKLDVERMTQFIQNILRWTRGEGNTA
jgi:hypothetical protein